MKVTILSQTDYASSGLKLCEQIKSLGVDIQIISLIPGSGVTKFGIRRGKVVSELGTAVVRERILSSDIIHFKGDWAYNGSWEGFKLPNVSKIYTFSGSMFRRGREKAVCLTAHNLNEYKAQYFSAFTPELCYSSDIKLMEFPCNDFDYRFKKGNKFKIYHIPSCAERKGTDVIEKAFTLLKRKDVEFMRIKNISHAESLRYKSECHLYIDQMLLPVYGNAAVEAMSFGVPVMNWDENLYPYPTPVIKPFDRTPEMVALEIEKYLDWDRLTKLSEETYEYCKNIHGTIGEKWIKIYNDLV